MPGLIRVSDFNEYEEDDDDFDEGDVEEAPNAPTIALVAPPVATDTPPSSSLHGLERIEALLTRISSKIDHMQETMERHFQYSSEQFRIMDNHLTNISSNLTSHMQYNSEQFGSIDRRMTQITSEMQRLHFPSHPTTGMNGTADYTPNRGLADGDFPPFGSC